MSVGVGVTLLANGQSAAEGGDRLVLIADTHVDADPDRVANGSALAGNLRRVVAEVLETSKTEPIGGVILNGDCAFMEGLEDDYRTLEHTLEPLQSAGIPVHLTMGNHDDRVKMLNVMKERRPENPPVSGKLVSILETKTANWFLLDTLEIVNRVTGALGTEQLVWLSEAIGARRDKPAIIVGHHNLQTDPSADTISGLRDTPIFRKVLNAHEHVAAYVFGHTHNWGVEPAHQTGPHFVNLPPTAYVFDRSRPNGWVLADSSTDGLTVTLHSLDHSHVQHREVHRLRWR
jgi:Icc protein